MTPEPEALRVADEQERCFPKSGKKAARLLREQHAEIEQLREANEAFGKRQEWWNQKMFDMELEIASLHAMLERRK